VWSPACPEILVPVHPELFNRNYGVMMSGSLYVESRMSCETCSHASKLVNSDYGVNEVRITLCGVQHVL
jgi:hypothetical protein